MAKERREDFKEFDVIAEYHRLDTCYWKLLEGISSFKSLAEVLKITLTLSHGQALVERGFSVNKSLLVENIATKSLIAQRIAYDDMKVNNVIAEDVEIRPTLCCSVKHARQRYSTYLEEQKKNKVQNIDLSNQKKFKRKSRQITRRKPY